MSFSYHKKYYNQNNSEHKICKENLEDVNFKSFKSIEQIKEFESYSDKLYVIPFILVYYLLELFKYMGIKYYYLLFFPLVIVALCNYFLDRNKKLRYKKYCLGETDIFVKIKADIFSEYFNKVCLFCILLLLPVHFVYLAITQMSGADFDIYWLILIIVLMRS